MKKQLKITFVKHRSAKSVVIGFFRGDHPRMPIKKLLKKHTVFQVLLGHTIPEATVEQLLKVVEKQKSWGYCKHISKVEKEIHYWVHNTADDLAIMELLGHEVGHAFGYSNEKRAQKIGAAAAFAYGQFITIKQEQQNQIEVSC